MKNEQLNRRQMLARSAQGLGVVAAAGSGMNFATAARAADAPHPLAPKPPHFEAKAKRVIMFFLNGGASHVDSFDPKEKLQKNGGEKHHGREMMASPWKAKPHGKCGTMATDLFPHIADQLDDICVIRSMHGDHNCHYQATLGMHTGSVTFPRPSIGAWVSYGLGTYNPNLPSYAVIADKAPYAGSLVWDANFLPAYHQGVRIQPGEDPVPNLKPHSSSGPVQDLELALLRKFNTEHSARRNNASSLKARMLSFKTAFGLQNTAPEVFDLSKESDATLKLYGIDRNDEQSFGWQCLMARRLAERGVRFVELFDIGSANNWDAHGDITSHGPLAKKIDRPIASLLQDLKMRGMLEDTLVVFCTEFGRSPWKEGGNGRSHHNAAYSCWLAGGGVQGGITYGATDEYGGSIADKPVHVHDFHATILHQLGLNHERLTYHHNGRDFRLTDVHGRIVRDILA